MLNPLQSCLLLALGLVAACGAPTPRPDYAIRVAPTAQGGVAQPPTCADWKTQNANAFDEQPEPQFGCADARNLATMIEKPNDLLQGRKSGDGRAVLSVGSVRRYDNNQTRGLIMPGAETNSVGMTTAPAASSSMTGDITNAAAGTPSAVGAP